MGFETSLWPNTYINYIPRSPTGDVTPFKPGRPLLRDRLTPSLHMLRRGPEPAIALQWTSPAGRAQRQCQLHQLSLSGNTLIKLHRLCTIYISSPPTFISGNCSPYQSQPWKYHVGTALLKLTVKITTLSVCTTWWYKSANPDPPISTVRADHTRIEGYNARS